VAKSPLSAALALGMILSAAVGAQSSTGTSPGTSLAPAPNSVTPGNPGADFGQYPAQWVAARFEPTPVTHPSSWRATEGVA
jgi:type 1 fimbria pilin